MRRSFVMTMLFQFSFDSYPAPRPLSRRKTPRQIKDKRITLSLPSGRKHPGTQYGTIRRFRYNPSDSIQNGTLSTMRNGPIHPATKSRRSPLENFRTCSVITGPAPAKPHYSRTTKQHFCKQFSPDYCMKKTGFAATRTVPLKFLQE